MHDSVSPMPFVGIVFIPWYIKYSIPIIYIRINIPKILLSQQTFRAFCAPAFFSCLSGNFERNRLFNLRDILFSLRCPIYIQMSMFRNITFCNTWGNYLLFSSRCPGLEISTLVLAPLSMAMNIASCCQTQLFMSAAILFLLSFPCLGISCFVLNTLSMCKDIVSYCHHLSRYITSCSHLAVQV